MPPAAPASRGALPADPGAAIIALADACVQCGLCLPHCPTYRIDRAETESPRGRIALARSLADGRLSADARVDAHLDHCLGCRRCEAVCPANVQYGELLERTRTRQRERRGTPWRQRAFEWLTARPALLDRLLGAYRQLYPILPRTLPRPPAHAPLPAPSPANPTGGQAAVFTGCIARRYDSQTHAALLRLCAAAGVTADVPAAQTCCGTLHAHAGDAATAAQLAQRNRTAFAAGVPVLTSASGCHEAVARCLDSHAPVLDASTYLLARADRLRFKPARVRAALHVPCTQRAVVHSDHALRALLARIPELELVDLPDTGCCGAAGTHMLAEPERAAVLRQPLLDAFAASGASVLLSANIGCRLHLAAGNAKIPARHPLDFLAEHLIGTSTP